MHGKLWTSHETEPALLHRLRGLRHATLHDRGVVAMNKPGAKARPRPCASCPYRQNVPSGVWDATEYAKLPEYDGDTSEQAIATFYCHQQDGSVCSGWLGHRDPYDLLAVRLGVSAGNLDVSVLDYTTDVPLFATGAEAAAHGMKDSRHPGKRAQAVIKKIITKKGITHAHDESEGR